MNIRLPMKQAYDKYDRQKNNNDPWMSPAQEQELSLILSRPKLFSKKLKEIRRRRNISVKQAGELQTAGFEYLEKLSVKQDKKPCSAVARGKIYHNGAILMPPDPEPCFTTKKNTPQSTPWNRWLDYRRRITPKDLRELRETMSLSPAWNNALTNLLLFNAILSLPFKGCGAPSRRRLAPLPGHKLGRYGIYVEVFKWTTIDDVEQTFSDYRNNEMLRVHLNPCRAFVDDSTGERRLFIEVGADTSLNDIRKVWKRTVRRELRKLPGRKRFCYIPQLDRTRWYKSKIDKYKFPDKAIAEVEIALSNRRDLNLFPDSVIALKRDAYRKALSRLKPKIPQ